MGSTKDGWLEEYTSVNKKLTYLEKMGSIGKKKGQHWQKKGQCWQTKGSAGKNRWVGGGQKGWVGGQKGWAVLNTSGITKYGWLVVHAVVKNKITYLLMTTDSLFTVCGHQLQVWCCVR